MWVWGADEVSHQGLRKDSRAREISEGPAEKASTQQLTKHTGLGFLAEGLHGLPGEVQFGHGGEKFCLCCAEFEVLEGLPGPPQPVGNHGSSLTSPSLLPTCQPCKTQAHPCPEIRAALDLIQAKGGASSCFLDFSLLSLRSPS